MPADEDTDLERGLLAAEDRGAGEGSDFYDPAEDRRRYRGFFGALLSTVEIHPSRDEFVIAQEI